MTLEFAFLMTPLGSNYDYWEAYIFSLYISKAFKKLNLNVNILNLVTDTPWLLFQNYSLYNSGNNLIDPKDTIGGQTLILITALNAVCASHVSNSNYVFFNRNGPTPNDGYGALSLLATTLGKRLCLIGDEARHLWGNSDNPLLIGSMSSVSNKLFNPPTINNRLFDYDTTNKQGGNCGKSTLERIIKESIEDTPVVVPFTSIKISTRMENVIKLGNLLNKEFQGNVKWSDCISKPLEVYNTIKKVFRENPTLFSTRDLNYMKSNTNIYGNNLIKATNNIFMSNNILSNRKNPISEDVVKEFAKLK